MHYSNMAKEYSSVPFVMAVEAEHETLKHAFKFRNTRLPSLLRITLDTE